MIQLLLLLSKPILTILNHYLNFDYSSFLFIPFFNLYWVFRAVPGLSAALHRNLRQINPSWTGGTAGHGLGIATAVISVIPYVNFLSPIFYLIWVPTANRAKNELLVLDEQRRLFAEEEGQTS